MSVVEQVEEYIAGLTLDARGEALASIARALASEVDSPPSTEKGRASVTAPAKELRACLADLDVIGAKRGDEGEGAGGWGSIATVTGLAEVRDAAGSVATNTRSRSRGGGSKAG